MPLSGSKPASANAQAEATRCFAEAAPVCSVNMPVTSACACACAHVCTHACVCACVPVPVTVPVSLPVNLPPLPSCSVTLYMLPPACSLRIMRVRVRVRVWMPVPVPVLEHACACVCACAYDCAYAHLPLPLCTVSANAFTYEVNYLQLHHCNAAPACVCALCIWSYVSVSVRCACMCTPCACVCTSVCVCVCASVSVYCRLQPRHERQHQPGHGAARIHYAGSEDTTGYWAADSLVPSPLSPLLPFPLHLGIIILLDRMRSDHTITRSTLGCQWRSLCPQHAHGHCHRWTMAPCTT